MESPVLRNPRQEATDAVDGRYRVRVLEPSPPARHDAPWFADDPVNEAVEGGLPVVSPVGNGDITWDELATREPHLAGFSAERWLGAWKALSLPPGGLAESRIALHQLAFHAVAPARHYVNTKIGLRYLRGGFGTPFFGESVQVRVEGPNIVIQRQDHVEAKPITTIGAARKLVAIDYVLPFRGPELWEPDRPLGVDPDHITFLSDWFGFVTSVLEQLRHEADPSANPSRVQIWPEHFDPAVEIGTEEGARRAAFGGSPGDEGHPEPYLYVSPWVPRLPGPFWNDSHFRGASLPYGELLAASDQREAALTFFGEGLAVMAGPR